MKTKRVLGQESYSFASDLVEVHLTRTGGHLGPVRFRLGKDRIVEPFHVAPWAEEKQAAGIPDMLRALRGDFFCAPFGGNAKPFRSEKHPPHGDTANLPWRGEALVQDAHTTTLRLALETQSRPGHVEKQLTLRAGQTAIYCRHIFSGMSGPMSIGHHAMLRLPEGAKNVRLTTSKLRFGQVVPELFEDPAQGGYTALERGATFSRLDQVPLAGGGLADLSRFPARPGFEDLALIVHEDKPDFAWSAVTFPGERYVWFALKDPRVLQSTVIWMSNGGRHYAPWNGRHRNVLAVEDVTAYFHLGLAESAVPNSLTQRGYATAVKLDSKKPFVVHYIMGVAELPAGFESVQKLVPGADGITLHSSSGRKAFAPLDLKFLHGDAA